VGGGGVGLAIATRSAVRCPPSEAGSLNGVSLFDSHAPGIVLPERAEHARSIAARVHQPDLLEMLDRAAQDYDEIAEDLEAGAIEMRHPELMPQRR